MSRLNNERGITLVELLASIVILGIILISVGSYFVNASKYSAASDNRLTNSQMAYNVLNVYKENHDLIGKVSPCPMGDLTEEEAIDKCINEASSDYRKTYIGSDYEDELAFSNDIVEQLENVHTTVTAVAHPNSEIKDRIIVLGIEVINMNEEISEASLIGFIRTEPGSE